MQESGELIVHPSLLQVLQKSILHLLIQFPVQTPRNQLQQRQYINPDQEQNKSGDHSLLEVGTHVLPMRRMPTANRKDLLDLNIIGPGRASELEGELRVVALRHLNHEGDMKAGIARVCHLRRCGRPCGGGGAVEHGGLDLDLLPAAAPPQLDPLLPRPVIDVEGPERGLRLGRGPGLDLVGDLGTEDPEEVLPEGGAAHLRDVGAGDYGRG